MNELSDEEGRTVSLPGPSLSEVVREAEVGAGEASRLAMALEWPVECEPAQWSARVLLGASSLLQERARRVWRRQLSTFLIAATVTLPLTLIAGIYGIELAYEFLCTLLPVAVATYLVTSYAMVALAVVGTTYAMIPIAVSRSRDRLAFAQSWEAIR